MWTRAELKDRAKDGLKRNYWKSVVVGLLVTLMYAFTVANGRGGAENGSLNEAFSGMSSGQVLAAIGLLFSAFLVGNLITAVVHAIIYNPLKVGISAFCMDAIDGTAPLKSILKGYGNGGKFFYNVWALFVRDLLVTLWSLLLVVPGIIKGLEYRLVEYVLADNPGIGVKDALAKSKELMKGHKWNVFVLDLSFLGWNILNILTLGILGVFYVQPYQLLTNAALYETLKQNA